MRIPEVRPYYDSLKKKQFSILIKRLFDIVAAVALLFLLMIPMLIIAAWIKADSDGPVFYRQERVTKDGKRFRIHKFRTMVANADRLGSAVTVGNDKRITGAGEKLRSLRLDELPQLLDVLKGDMSIVGPRPLLMDELPQLYNIFCGDMSFVGTRPEAAKYVERYKPEYYATLLLPAGITSEASIRYKDENKLLNAADDVDRVYVEQVLPGKMKWNLEEIRRFQLLRELATMFRTVAAVCGKDFS